MAPLLRELAGRAGRALTSFSASSGSWSKPAPGFEPPSPDTADRDAEVKRSLRSQDAMLGRVTYYSGPSQDRYSSYPGTGLEPQQIWNLILLRNQGYPDLWTQLVEQSLERDGHLGGIYDTRRQSVADKPFRIHPAYRGDPLADVIAKIEERIIDRIDSFDQSTEDLLSASAYGYALAEIVWEYDRVRIPTLDGTVTLTLVVPRTVEWVHWKHVRFDRWTDEPYLWMARGGEYSIPPNKFVFHASAGTGLIEKRGFMGSCVWLSAAKRWSERDWLVYAKIFGIPMILGKYPDGHEEYEAHREKYAKLLADWGEGIPALVPESLATEISREAGGRSNDLHGAIIGWANAEMSKRVLGSTLTVEIGNQGAYAAADTHRDAPYMRSRADARKLAATYRRDLLAPILYVNQVALAKALGQPAEEILDRVPKCSWRIEREMTPMDRQKVFEGAVNELGLEVDEDEYRDEFGLDAPRPGGRKLRGKPVPVGTGGLAPSVEASKDGAEPPEKEPAKVTQPALEGAKPETSPEEPSTEDAGGGRAQAGPTRGSSSRRRTSRRSSR